MVLTRYFAIVAQMELLDCHRLLWQSAGWLSGSRLEPAGRLPLRSGKRLSFLQPFHHLDLDVLLIDAVRHQPSAGMGAAVGSVDAGVAPMRRTQPG